MSARSLGQYDWDDGATLRITLAGDKPTEVALAMVERLVALKRKELAALAQGMEAGTGETALAGSTESEASGDSPTPQRGDAP